MIKFQKRGHASKENHGKWVITYSVSEVILGILLMALVAIHIYTYVNANSRPSSQSYSSIPAKSY